MATISQVTISGTTYDIADAPAREITSLFWKDDNGDVHLTAKGPAEDTYWMDFYFTRYGEIWAHPYYHSDGTEFSPEERIIQYWQTSYKTQAEIFSSVTSGWTIVNCTLVTDGRIAQAYFTVKCSTAQSSGTVTIGTLKSDFKPAVEIGAFEGTVANPKVAYIDANGNLKCSFSSSATLAANANLYIKVPCYIIGTVY